MKQLTIRRWRVIEIPEGVLIFCDPRRERIVLLEEEWVDRPAAPSNQLERELQQKLKDQLDLEVDGV